MEIQALRAELEQLFDLDELRHLSDQLLGLDPETVGATKAKASFARALVEHCARSQAIDALCDAMVALRPEANAAITRALQVAERAAALVPGTRFGSFEIQHAYGQGVLGATYRAERDGQTLRLKVLHPYAGYDQRGLQQFLTYCRRLAIAGRDATRQGAQQGWGQLAIERVEDYTVLVQPHQEGVCLAERLGKQGPAHLSEVAPWVRSLLESLSELHARGLVHGNLKLENLLLVSGRGHSSESSVTLQDAGGFHLRSILTNDGAEPRLSISNPQCVAPEVLLGSQPTQASDLYAFGVVLYQALTGTLPFSGETPLHQALARLEEEPVAPSDLAPKGAVSFELDSFVLQLLSPNPAERLGSAAEALRGFDSLLSSGSGRAVGQAELEQRIAGLLETPDDEDAALALESLADGGADPMRIAETFRTAFEQLTPTNPHARQEKVGLGLRAGRLFRRAGQPSAAEALYAELLELEPHNKVAASALEDLRKQLGKHEELIDLWLAQVEACQAPAEKAELLIKIGNLYERTLGEPGQAVVAYTQAFCENPSNRESAQAVERLANKAPEVWPDVLGTCNEASQRGLKEDDQIHLFNQMGHWCREKLNRFDLAIDYFQWVLRADAANESALEGLGKVHRKLQQWPQLAELLLRRAAAAGTPELARRLQLEAADIYASKLKDEARATELYERILEEEPTHQDALAALGALYQQAGDHAAYVRLLQRRAEDLRGPDRHSLLCRIGETYEQRLGASSDALRAYESVFAEDPTHFGALSGLDRLYDQLGRHDRLLNALEAMVRIAGTPRQKATLYERIASLYESEFLDPAKAAQALHKVLEIDARNEDALSGLERLARAQGHFNELLDLYQRHANVVEEPRRKADFLVERAKLLAGPLGSPHQAVVAFEGVLAVMPDHAEALAALAELKQQSGDADEALRALETLAENSTTPSLRADNYARAAKLLEKRSDLAGAVERYKLALDALPQHNDAATGLRHAYLKLGDAHAAVEVLRRHIAVVDSLTARAKLTAELAKLAYERLNDLELAEQAARQALDWNDTSIDAQEVLGGIALDQQRYDEAAYRLERLLPHLESLGPDRSVNLLVHYVDALARLGSTEAALGPVQKLRELAPDDPRALMRVARVLFDQGADVAARDLYGEILERFEDQLSTAERSAATYYHGEATRRTGQLGLAISMLEEAADLDPNAAEPLRALAEAYADLGDWEESWEANSRLLDLVHGEEKVQLLLDMAETAMDKLDDRQRATRCLVAALDLRPEDRRLLTRLMQLYSEDKDWAKAVDVVLKLAQFVDDPRQKARYLMTAGLIAAREMQDSDVALACFAQVMELDPELNKALEESVVLYRQRGDFAAAERLLKDKMKAASRAKDTEKLLEAFTALGELYKDAQRVDSAIEAYEAAHTLDPDNRERLDVLAQLYGAAPQQYFDKAVAANTRILEHDPYRADAYSALRKLYTEIKNPDGAWCLCQALSVLKLAAPDEERFYKRMRAEDPAFAQDVLTAEDWAADLTHPDQEPLLTELFAIIEPVVVQSRGYEFRDLGYDPAYQVALEHHAYPVGQTLHYAAGVMGIAPPPCFENTNDPGGLVFLDTKIPAVSMGLGVLNPHLPAQLLAFICGHHLSYYRPGHFLRQMVGTGTGLKSWLFAAIKLISPGFPVAQDLEGPVEDAVAILRMGLHMHAKDDLARAVSKLLQSAAALDLKRWVSGVDFTADRLGLLLAHDLATAVEVVQGGEEATAGIIQRRLKELVLFSISPNYLRLRARLGVHLSI